MMKPLLALTICTFSASAAAEVIVPVHLVNEKGVGEKIGSITVTESTHGVQFKPDLRDLPPGQHGFHVHENGSCEPAEKDGKINAAGAAGSHYDPHEAKKHGAPWGDGHLGDLPALTVNTNGTSTQPIVAPRLKLSEINNRALIIHAGSDNYSDYPEPLGGGGARIACGVIAEKQNTADQENSDDPMTGGVSQESK